MLFALRQKEQRFYKSCALSPDSLQLLLELIAFYLKPSLTHSERLSRSTCGCMPTLAQHLVRLAR